MGESTDNSSESDESIEAQERFEEFGKEDWLWDYDNDCSIKEQGYRDSSRYGDKEEFVNYIVE